MENSLNLYSLVWAVSIAFLLLFSIVCFALYQLVKEKSFRYYSIYCFFLILYLFTKHPITHDLFSTFDVDGPYGYLALNYNWMIQIIFYTFYTLFAIYFIDLDHQYPRVAKIFRKIHYYNLALAAVLFLICNLLKNGIVLQSYFLFVYVPFLIFQTIYLIPKIINTKGLLTQIFVVGVLVYTWGALVALYLSFNQGVHQLNAPIIFFLLGVIIENICFGLGITIKYKQIHDEKSFQKVEITRLNYNEELAALKGLMEGEQKERSRIARELHDGLGSLVATILMQLELSNRTIPQLDNNKNFKKAVDLLENASDELHNIAHDMMPKNLMKYGLIPSVKEMTENISDLEIHFFSDQEEYNINEKQSFIIYRMIQESMNNIIKHANANEVSIIIRRANEHLQISISDDGRGFDVNDFTEGIGLKSLRSRVNLIKGDLQINSKPGIGTEVIILVPFTSQIIDPILN